MASGRSFKKDLDTLLKVWGILALWAVFHILVVEAACYLNENWLDIATEIIRSADR